MAFAFAALVGLKAAAAATGLTFVVDSTSDAVDASVGNGVCATSAGTCTLRAAVQEANALPGADVVRLPGGTYALALRPQGENDATRGDLDVTDELTVAGAGAGSTVVDAGVPLASDTAEVRGIDRLFEIVVGDGVVTLSGLTLSDGYAAEYGGAILHSGSATLRVVDSVVRGSVAGKTGGAIDNRGSGRVEVLRSTLSSNYAVEDGSAVNNNLDGSVELRESTVSGNSAAVVGLDPSLRGAGAVSNHAEHDSLGTITVVDSLFSENRAGGGRSGGGISNRGAGTIVVERTTFAKNGADSDGGAIFNGTGAVTVRASTFSENGATDGGAIASTGGAVDVRDSTFTKNSAEGWGGGLVNSNQGSATIRSTTFHENVGLNGGGFANEGTGRVVVEDSTFTKNGARETVAVAGGEGGGMHSNSGGEVVVTGGAFSENTAANGGGLSNEGGGTTTITGTRFSANVADERGGGILVEGGAVRMVAIDVVGNISKSAEEGGGGISYAGDKSVSLEESAAIERSRIRDNKSDGDGGGIDSRGDGPLVVTTTAVTGNTAVTGGAIHHVGDATLLVDRSTLSANTAQHGGGAFTDGDGEATLENTTVSGNLAGQLGGGLLVSSRLTVRSSTITRNSAPSGGGINNGGGAAFGDGLVFLANSIVAGNPAGGNCVGTMTSRGGNVENTSSCQLTELSDQPGTDPLLGPLADNGGPTQTHALLAGSPAQDRAACTELDPCPPVDQRGVERPRFERFDAGAYESELTPGAGGPPSCAGRSERPVPADFDSWVSQSSASANFGSDSILNIRSQAGASERALVHFALPPVPPGCRLVGATLRLYASSGTEGRTLSAMRLASAWSELGVTWSNQPATAGAAATSLSGPGFLDWDVLAQTLEMYAQGAHGFLVRDAGESGSAQQSFHSREKGIDRPPELVLVFDDPDDPLPPGDCPKTPQAFTADRDGWVSQGSASSNFGTDSSLKVKSQGGSNSRALVRFALPPLPPGCTSVASAVLRVEASSAKEGRTLEALQVALPWTEAGVTWNNQPPVVGAAATTASVQGVVEWQVTPQVLGIYTSANHGFLIRDGAEDGVGDEQSLSSREKASEASPTLVLAFDDSTPETSIDAGPASPTEATSATFAFSSDRVDSSFECSLDGAPFQSCASPFAVGGLAPGGHAFAVRATRKVRAVDPTPAVFEWVVVGSAETSVSGPASPSASAEATFEFASSDPQATFECSLDGAPFAACSSPAGYGGLGDGEHEFLVRSVDPTGGADPTPAIHRWVVAVPPETTITAQPPATTTSGSAVFAFGGSDNQTAPDELAFECSLDGASFAPCTSPAEYGVLADGSHTFAVRAVDLAGNADPSPASYGWMVDTVSPETAIDSAPADPSGDSSPSFAFSSEGAILLECRLDGGDWERCESPRDYASIADGAHVFEVRGTDRAGNTDASPATHAWTVDTAAPETAIESGPPATSLSSAAGFAFGSEPGAGFECRLDGGDWATCTSPHGYAALADGAHVFEVRARDAAGNLDPTPASWSWTIDAAAPETTIESGPPALSQGSTASFAFASEPGASFECRLDGGDWAACTSPQGYPALADGPHRFEVRARDVVGNLDPTPASWSWTIDTAAPETTIDSGPPATTTSASASFAFSADEPGATFVCSLDGATPFACVSPLEYGGLAPGTHRFAVRATDRAGNAEPEPAQHEWTIDPPAATPPDTVIASGPPATTTSVSATLVFSGSDAETDPADLTFDCRLDAGDWAPCTSPHSYAALAEGSHTFDVRAIDAAGTVDPTPAAWSWTIDTTGPETTIAVAPPTLSQSSTAGFAFTSEPDATFECRLDAGDWAPCTSPHSYTALADGTHSFEVRAVDEGGTPDPSPASHTWTIDTTAPETRIDSGPPATTSSSDATFTFSADDADARFDCSLDNADYAPCTSPLTHTGLLAGAHRLRVRATDAAGNPDPSPASHTWTIDTTAPDTTIAAAPPALSQSSTAGFAFTSEPGATFECRLDGGAWAPCTSPHSYTALGDGTHGFEVRALDEGGTPDPSPASHTWTIDTTAPDTRIDSGPPAQTQSTSATFLFSADDPGATFACSLDGEAFAGCASPQQYSGLALGTHRFEVRATDPAGNVEPEAAGHQWTITAPPATAPDTSITAAPPATTNSTTATFSFTGSDAESAPSSLTFECRLDGGAWAPCTSPHSYTALGDGTHGFEVRALDEGGTADPSPASHTWTIDTTAPETRIDSGPPATTTSPEATFAFFASEFGSSFECALDSEAFAGCASPRVYTGLAAGPHSFHVRATDAAGTTDATPATYSWTISAQVSCTPATVTVGAAADSWVLESSATSNYGNDSVIKVDTKADANARALVRFALPPIPAGCRVTDARLRLNASSSKEGRILEAVRLAAPWTEHGVTWSNQPATAGSAATATSDSGYVEWSAAALVQAMYASGNHGFLVRDAVEGGTGVEQGFHSREKGTDSPPVLVLTFQ